MKKHQILSLLLAIALLVPMASCVDNAPKSDVWDGTVAEGFSKGDGSKAAPFEISTSAELAYLAKSTNEGNTYADKFFSLKCDLDLNDIEWTPIGTHSSRFSGSFDGNGHTISNLKMTDVITDTVTNSAGSFEASFAGLFGICNDASFCNLKLDDIEISIKNAYLLENIFVGTLAARLSVNTNSTITNIQVKNASLIRHAQKEEVSSAGTFSNLFGGIFGSIQVKNTASCMMSKVQSDVYMNLREENFCYLTSAGGIVADLVNSGTFECNDFAVYANAEFIDVNLDEHSVKITYSTLGNITSSGILKLSSGYSELKLNQAAVYPYQAEDPGLTATAMIGLSPLNTDGSKLEFNNLFGCVKRTDDVSAEPIDKLFFMGESTGYTANNCKATDTLLENHNFATSIWDLSDLSNPKLK